MNKIPKETWKKIAAANHDLACAIETGLQPLASYTLSFEVIEKPYPPTIHLKVKILGISGKPADQQVQQVGERLGEIAKTTPFQYRSDQHPRTEPGYSMTYYYVIRVPYNSFITS